MFLSDLLGALARRPVSPSRWRILCLIFGRIAVTFNDPRGKTRSFHYSLAPAEIRKAEWSLVHLPALARECSCGLVDIAYDVRHVSRPLASLTHMGGPNYWPSPQDVSPELVKYAPDYDSVFVLWPQNNTGTGCQVPSAGWGLAIGPGHIPGGGTYCSIANAADNYWDVPRIGEVWLHEWLHGVCDLYENRGYPMPAGNADGGGSHGYVQSPVTGWCRYYRDLMTGQVKENGRMTGITPEAWLSGTIRQNKKSN